MALAKNKYVIYTAMVGGYDEIMQPKVVDDRFDYVLFSNDIKEDRVGVWQVRSIAYTNPDNTRICRYVKTHPEELLQGYSASIWIDSNIVITSSSVYDRAIELYNVGALIAAINHLGRDCIYDEAFEVMCHRFELERNVVVWCNRLRREGYPQHNGLYETGVMFRKHNTTLVREANVMWWNCIEKYSKRDQLSFNYVLWKLNINCEYFLDKASNARNSACFQLLDHVNFSKKYCTLQKGQWMLKYMYTCPDKRDQMKKNYEWISAQRYPFVWLEIIGQYYRIKDFVIRNIQKRFK